MTKQQDITKEPAQGSSLRAAISKARIEAAEDIDGTIDLRSAEFARLDLLKTALEDLFLEIPPDEDRFELALMPSNPARLWIDMLSYVEMDADCEAYRFVRNERAGRRVIVESHDIGVLRGRIAEYIARQMVARERQLSGLADLPPERRRRRRSGWGYLLAFLLGAIAGAVALFAFGWFITQ
ncbi:MAG: hypothetical protein D6773_12735 [Alphaproteobacteria bacterium]|nr:MAG: hypothetical protein D6773_12735 [Alphaproteobacteria bacterium]